MRKLDEVVQSLVICMTEAHTEVRKTTVFISKDFTVKLTRQHKHDKRSRGHTLLLTYGKPNYAERKFYAAYKKRHGITPEGAQFITQWPKKKVKK